MQLLIEQFEHDYAQPTTSTSCVPGNTVAERLYLSLGFQPTGEIKDGEIVVRRELR
jgi:RimJ/RimL family protein N-acetyltransferase